jgi:hypothetical protein
MAKTNKSESDKTPAKKAPAKAPAEKAAKPAAAKPTTATAAAAAKPATSAAKAAPAKKAAAKKAAPANTASASTPLIDTNLVAQTAAAMLINRPSANAAAPQAGKESSAFKNLKDQLAKPKPTGLSNLFGPTGDAKKSGGHFNAHQQKGHNQTFGGLNKTGVPRRTNG